MPLVILGVVIALFAPFALGGLRIGLFDRYPITIYALLAVALVATIVGLRRTTRRRLAWSGVAVVGLVTVVTMFSAHVFTSYGVARPLGPAVGEAFPHVTLIDATTALPFDVAAAPADKKATFIVFFRGFW